MERKSKYKLGMAVVIPTSLILACGIHGCSEYRRLDTGNLKRYHSLKGQICYLEAALGSRPDYLGMDRNTEKMILEAHSFYKERLSYMRDSLSTELEKIESDEIFQKQLREYLSVGPSHIGLAILIGLLGQAYIRHIKSKKQE